MGAGQSELIRRIAGVIGHELRNPMAVINNSAYFVRSKLASSALDPKVEKHLKIIESEIARADHMISDILFFTRPCQAALETKNMDQVIEAALTPTETPTPCQIEFKPGAKGANVALDVRLLTSALGRLIDNACDAMEGKGVVHIRTGIDGQDVWLSVSDSGKGVADSVRQTLFDPFITTKPRGLGLGLTYVQKVVQAQGGRIDHQTGPKGTDFRLIFPRA